MQPRLPSHQSWHNQSPEKRPLKSRSSGLSVPSNKSGGSAPPSSTTSSSQRDKEQLLPDVYPQLVNQEEDKMSTERLSRGYQLPIPMEEYDSLMKLGSAPRLRMERLGDGCMRSAEWISTIASRRSQLSVVALDKKRIKDGTFQNFGQASGANKQREYQRFFEELVRIKSLQRLVKVLQQRDKNKKHVLYFPAFAKRREESLDYIHAFKVPLQKALWFLKISQFVHQSSLTPIAGSSTQQQQRQQQLAQKQQRSSAPTPGGWELCAIDLTKVLTKYLRDLLRKLDSTATDAATTTTNAAEKQRWPYFAALYKHCFEEGCVDRMEFLSELVDMLAEYMVHPWERPYVFRLLVLFTSQFTAELTQNAWLARKVAFVLCRKLWMLRSECEARRGTPCSASECLRELENCSLMRPIVLTSLGLLHAIITDCPVAMLFSPSNSIEHCPNAAGQWWLCGSPLDWLPIDESASADLLLSQHLPESMHSAKEQLKECVEAIRTRSENIDARWTIYEAPLGDGSEGQEDMGPTRDTFECLVDVCLNTLSALDQFSVSTSKAVLRLYKTIFCPTPEAEEGMSRRSLLIRLRLLFQWAITHEREGSHRAYVVCQLLQMRIRHKETVAFGKFGTENQAEGEEGGSGDGSRVETQVQDLLLEFLAREGPRPPVDGEMGEVKGRFETEFANLMLLLAEMQRHRLFSHDQYARALIRSGQLDHKESVMARLGPLIPPPPAPPLPKPATTVEPPPVKPAAPPQSSTSSGKSGNEPHANPAIISFIPTSIPSVPAISALSAAEAKRPLSAPPPHLQSKEGCAGGSKGSRDMREEDEDIAALPPLYPQPDREHQLVGEPRAVMSMHERLLIHMPMEQVEEMRDASNQRASLLYGIASEQREEARLELKKLAREICKLWQRRLAVEFFPESREVRMRRRITREAIQEQMLKFHALSYHDQWVVAGWCAGSLLEQINDFLQAQGFLLPTMESLDLVCGMMEICQNLSGLIDFIHELLPLLLQLDSYLLSFRSDLIPGHVSAQLGYVLVGYLAEHFTYFALQAEASSILNGLYRLVEKELCAIGYPISGWARSIAVFMLHAKNELLSARLNDQPLLGTLEQLKSIFPESGVGLAPEGDLKYNPSLLTDLLKEPKRFYAYNDYKLRLPSIEDEHTRYSFVVNALLVAKGAKRNFDTLAELATLCAHISAQKHLAGEWCAAVQELCYSSVSSKSGYSHLIREINVDDASSIHYPLATFVTLLASKYAFSAHALLLRIVNNVFGPVIKSDNGQLGSVSGGGGGGPGNRSFDGSEMGLCLALRIVAALLCGTDQPFTLPDETRHPPERLMETGRRQSTADLRALRVTHLREMDVMIAPVLSAIAILMDQLKRKISAKSGNIHRLNQLLLVVKCTLFAVCEQEWVVQRIFRICECQPQLDSFNCPRLKHNSIGHQLLRIALRRRCERRTKQQLMVCNGNSKKALFDKLLSAMTLWNMRATYYDLKLMIKEVTPDGSQKHVQQQAIVAEALICEIAKCCRDLFLVGECASTAEARVDSFRFDQIDCYWLMAPLIAACPRPENIPQTYNGQVTVKAKFLKEAATILAADVTSSPTSLQSFSMPSNQDSPPPSARERLEQSSRLLAQQPFVNLIMTCVQGEDSDAIVNTLLRHVQSLVQKTKDNACYPFSAFFLRAEREALLLRLDLIAGLFDTISASNSQIETWALALFQLLQLELVTPDREARYFQLCYDMLATLVINLIASSTIGGGQSGAGQSSSGSPSDAAKGQQSLLRYPAYNAWVKKLRREMGDRPIPGGLQCLAQLLPLPKTYAEWNAWESFAQSPSSSLSSMSVTMSGGATAGSGKGGTGGVQLGQSQAPSPWSQINTTAIRLERQPSTVQKQLIRMLYHSHYDLFPQAGIVGVDSVGPDPFLSALAIEYISDSNQLRTDSALSVENNRQVGGLSPASHQQQTDRERQQSFLQQQQQQQQQQQHQYRMMQARQQSESAVTAASLHTQQQQFMHPPVSQQMTVPAMEQQQPSSMVDQTENVKATGSLFPAQHGQHHQFIQQQQQPMLHPSFAIPRSSSGGGAGGPTIGGIRVPTQHPQSIAKAGGRKKNPGQQQAGLPGPQKGTKRKKETKCSLPTTETSTQIISQQARMMQQLPGPGAAAMAMMGGSSGGQSMMNAHHQQQLMQQQHEHQQQQQQQYLAWQHQQMVQQQRAGMMAGGAGQSSSQSTAMMHPHQPSLPPSTQVQPPLPSTGYQQLSQAEVMQEQQLKVEKKSQLHNKILQRVQANQQQQQQLQLQNFPPQHQYQHHRHT